MIPVFRKSFMIVGMLVLVLAIIMLLMPRSIANNQVVQVEFQETTISPGETTNLIVTIRNNLANDMEDVEITANPVDKTSLIITKNIQTEEIIGVGEVRKFIFPVSVYDDVREGIYSVEVDTTIKDQSNIRVTIEVEE